MEILKKTIIIIIPIIIIMIIIPILFISIWDTIFGTSLEAYKETSDEYVVEYVKNKIYNETGDDVIVEILDKYTMIEVNYIDSYSIVKNRTLKKSNVYKYELKIINTQNSELTANGTYMDSYKTGRSYKEEKFESNYKYEKNFLNYKKNFEDIVCKYFDDYYLYTYIDKFYTNKYDCSVKDKRLAILLCDDNDKKLHELFLELDGVLGDFEYNAFIFTDKTAYNSMSSLFDKKEPIIINLLTDLSFEKIVHDDKSVEFNENLFNQIPNLTKDYKYSLFWYNRDNNNSLNCVFGHK